MAEKKFYSFLNVTDGPDGIKNCTTAVTLIHPELKDLGDGKKVLTCNASLSNREKMLASVLGCDIVHNDGTVWIDVQFWNNLAERFQKFLGDRDKVRVVLCGRLSVRKWTADDGTEKQKVQISANDWFVLPSYSKKENEVETAGVEDEEELY